MGSEFRVGLGSLFFFFFWSFGGSGEVGVPLAMWVAGVVLFSCRKGDWEGWLVCVAVGGCGIHRRCGNVGNGKIGKMARWKTADGIGKVELFSS
jgi:energy-converting hydrogenase Eha subunit G